ncbi:hypothetical protein AVEN_267998-1, partial [Araneus ventricosus]
SEIEVASTECNRGIGIWWWG